MTEDGSRGPIGPLAWMEGAAPTTGAVGWAIDPGGDRIASRSGPKRILEPGPCGMSWRQVLRISWVELAIVALIIGVLNGCLWPIVRDARGPAGLPIPDRLPEESRRVRHPLGFSMVVPPDWNCHIGGSLLMAPATPGRYARRSKALIVVARIGPDRPAGLGPRARTRFQGGEAYEGMRVVRPWSFDDGAWSEYTLDFRRGGHWYEVRYGIAEERQSLPPIVRRYLDTLRWGEGQPATVPDRRGTTPRARERSPGGRLTTGSSGRRPTRAGASPSAGPSAAAGPTAGSAPSPGTPARSGCRP